MKRLLTIVLTGVVVVGSVSSVSARGQTRKGSLSEEPSASSTCALSVSTADAILLPGESTSVEVWARFPADAYAFASSEFDVNADSPGWSYASDGAIAGGSVVGIVAEQNHQPHVGVWADPANPLHLWTGDFTPDSYEPRVANIEAIPSDFWFYPSELTSSDASCAALSSKRSILINPIRVGEYAAAPGKGTELTVLSEDPFHLAAESRSSAVRISLISAAVQGPRRARSRVEVDAPDGLTWDVQFHTGSGQIPVESLSLNYDKVESEIGGYAPTVSWSEAPFVEYILLPGPDPAGKRTSYAADGSSPIELIQAIDGAPAPFQLSDLPDTYQMDLDLNDDDEVTAVVLTTTFDVPVTITFDSGRTTTAQEVKRRMSCGNNFRQLGMALHSFGAVGSSKMTVGME